MDVGPRSFTVSIDGGVATVLFDRPPVNAFARNTYVELGELIDEIELNDEIRVVVLAAPETARCWCGGADLNDFVGMDHSGRKERYAFINEIVPRLYAVEKPVIAALTGHAIGVGVLLAAACDLRVAAEEANFSSPEVSYGLIAGSSKLLNYLGVPEALVREMAYTGQPVSARRMLEAGFLNRVVPRAEVIPAALELARAVAAKSMPVLKSRKRAFVMHESLGWLDAYKFAQAQSAELVGHKDSQAGVRAFLGGHTPVVSDT